jgi:hypothetical protein
MNKSLWAKIFGWSQFAVTAAGTVAQQFAQNPSSVPHGAWGWMGFATSLLTAVGVHHASNTNGAN